MKLFICLTVYIYCFLVCVYNIQIEYDVDAEFCSLTKKLDDDKCNAVKKSKVMFPSSGYLIYGVASQHIGATGAAFYGQGINLNIMFIYLLLHSLALRF